MLNALGVKSMEIDKEIYDDVSLEDLEDDRINFDCSFIKFK